MRFLWKLFWIILALASIAGSMYLTGNFELVERLTGIYLEAQTWVPATFGFEHFLVATAVAGALAAALMFLVSVVLVGRIGVSRFLRVRQAATVREQIDRVRQTFDKQYEQVLSLGQALTEQLDRRVMIQTIVQSASRMSSVPEANGSVSLWLLHFETDTFRFERGLYCDETLFTKADFQQNESPFSQVVTTQQPWVVPSWQAEGFALVNSKKTASLGSATSLMVIPLVIENTVLGALVIFCHPDLCKAFGAGRAFFEAMWGQLTLALAIAIQGELAILDRLTGTYNREYLMKRLVQEIDRSNRYQLPMSLLMIDIDNFKLVNDILGHPQGDAVLKIISKLIRKSIRAIDLVGRYGGEEFIVLLPETSVGPGGANATGAVTVAERIRKAVDDEFRGLQKPLNLTVSVGVAGRRFPEDREADHKELIRIADEQLYRAKTSGKNKVCVFRPAKPEGASS